VEVRNLMTENPACCTPDTDLQEVARMMEENDCGCIPVVEEEGSQKLVGVVTYRDITLRTFAQGKNPLEMTAADCMSSPVATVPSGASVADCCKVMEENQVRRVPVVDESGNCCGMVAQADLARHVDEQETGGVVQEVSQSSEAASGASHKGGCC